MQKIRISVTKNEAWSIRILALSRSKNNSIYILPVLGSFGPTRILRASEKLAYCAAYNFLSHT